MTILELSQSAAKAEVRGMAGLVARPLFAAEVQERADVNVGMLLAR